MPNAQGEMCELHLLGAARRPQNLHSDVTTLADQCLLFRVQGRLTLERLRLDGMIDNDAEWDRIRTMPNLHYKLWTSQGATEWGSITDAFAKRAIPVREGTDIEHGGRESLVEPFPSSELTGELEWPSDEGEVIG